MTWIFHTFPYESFCSYFKLTQCNEMRRKYVAALMTRTLIHGWLLVGCTHDRSVPMGPDGNVDPCGRVHSALRLSQPIWINEWERTWKGQHWPDQMCIQNIPLPSWCHLLMPAIMPSLPAAALFHQARPETGIRSEPEPCRGRSSQRPSSGAFDFCVGGEHVLQAF